MYKFYTAFYHALNPRMLSLCPLKANKFVVLVLFIIVAVQTAGYAQVVNFKKDNASLKEVIDEFQKQTGYNFIVSAEFLKKAGTLNVDVRNLPLGEALDKCFRGKPLTYTINKKTVVISEKSLTAERNTQTSIPVKGKIIANNGEILAGATIKVKNTQTGTISNQNGDYKINVPNENAVLVFSLLGYEILERKVPKNGELNVMMQQKDTGLNEVVVTALGIKREEKALGYAVTQVTGEQLTDAVSNNWSDALSGKVAGLNLVRSNSGPTGSNKIILRGETNLTNGEDNAALIVVDGVVINQGSGRRSGISGESIYALDGDNRPADYGSNLEDINPEDIESVTVLKGAGAAALYGQRGANGAIIITTKSGNPKRKGLGITFNSNTSLESINRWPDLQFEYGQGSNGEPYYSYGTTEDGGSTSGVSRAYGPRFEGQLFYQYDPALQGRGTERTPWTPYTNKVREFFDVGRTFRNSISLDGGTDKTMARFSFSNVQNNWIIPNTGYSRNSVALSVNSKVNDKLQITAKVSYNNKWSDNLPSAGYGNQSLMYWFMSWVPNGDIDWLKDYWKKGQEQLKMTNPFSVNPRNPYAIAYEFLNRSNRNAVTGNVQATYSFSKYLSLQLRTSIDLSNEQRAQQRPYDSGNRYPKGSYRTQNIYSQEASSDFMLKYQKKFGKSIDFSATVGGSTLKNIYVKDEVRADSLVYAGLYSMANSAGPLVTLPYSSQYAINSFYGLFSIGYKNYLFGDFTIRQDYNSTLATPDRTENSGFFYPSANLSFIASDFFRLPKIVNLAKLRFSVAGVGSGGTRPYITAYNYQSAGSIWSGGLQNPTTLPNPDLKPLRTTTYELGTDIRMFRSRLGIDLTLYTGDTKDQILDRIVDRASGYNRAIINAGAVRNKGIEVELKGTPIDKKKGFKWTTSFNFSANKNIITQLVDSSIVISTGPNGGGQIVANVGGSMGDLYGRGYVRSPDGQVMYDANTGFALISEDLVYLGNTIPKWKMGFNNEFRYKQFKLGLLFDAQYGAVAHSFSNHKLSEQGKTTNTLPGRYNGAVGNGVVQNPDGSYRTNDVIAMDIEGYYKSHFGADNAEGNTFSTDFIKFREARLDYTLNPKLAKKLGLQKATLGIYGRDLYIWSKWPIFDPEFGTLSGSDIIRGFEIAQFPSTRTFGFNLIIGI